MENNILNNLSIFGDVDEESMSKVIECIDKELEYQAKYGIYTQDIKYTGSDLLEYWIVVPEKSELESDSNFKMEGIYLAKQFKSFAIDNLSKAGLSKIRVRVHYTSMEDSTWTKEDSAKSLEEYNDKIKSDIEGRFSGYLKNLDKEKVC